MIRAPGRMTTALLGLAVGACAGPPDVPLHPTWSDVEPILQGECNHCHGATARMTGALGPAAYRFDFYDVTDAVCGEAAAAMDFTALAAASASLIKADVTPHGVRAKMPPAPGPSLHDWERETLQRWADDPVKGPPPPGNRAPSIRVNHLPQAVSGRLAFIATVDDADADSVVGVIKFGPMIYKMDHPGSYAVALDMTDVPAGPQRLSAVLCDGWFNITYDLGPITVMK